MLNYIIPITEREFIPKNIGGKAKSLFILKRNKIIIPTGFVIKSNAFNEHISKLKFDGKFVPDHLMKIKKIQDIDRTTIQEIRNIIVDNPIPQKISNEIRDAIQKYTSKFNYAIRSSANVEDSAKFSWAGQFESYLNIPNIIDEIEYAIKKVWASTFSHRSISYCIDNKITSIIDLKMSVIIQDMVRSPEFSGVLFTESPIMGNKNSMYMEFVKGYGDKLVSGSITPHKLLINKDEFNLDGNCIIDTKSVRSLTKMSILIEKIFKQPQDVEWSLSKGIIFFLQSRPITSFNISSADTTDIFLKPLITGLPVSSGIGVGSATVIHNIHDASNIKKGEIIIAPMTNPDMVPYMRNSSAIVTDVGGMISHTAIVAREMQIPCIVGTNNATKLVKTGDIITVNGNTGNVYHGNVKFKHNKNTISEIVKSISDYHDDFLNQDKVCFYYGIARFSSKIEFKEIIVNPYYIDQQIRFQKARNISKKHTDVIKNNFISNIVNLIKSTNCKISIYRSETIINLANNEFIQENKNRVTIINKPATIFHNSKQKNNFSEFKNSKNFFGHIPDLVFEGYPYPPRNGPWWPENWIYKWEVKTLKDKIQWGNIRPEIVNTPFTKSLIVQGVEKIPFIFKIDDTSPLFTKWKHCRIHIDINKLNHIRFELVNRYTNNINSFFEYIRQLHNSYDEWDCVTKKIQKSFTNPDHDIKSLLNQFKTLWEPHENFFALCFLIQTFGDDLIWPKIQNFLSNTYKNIGFNDFEYFSSQITKILASPPEKTLSRIYLEDLLKLKKVKQKTNISNRAQWSMLLKKYLKKWYWMRDRDLYYPPIDTPEKVELLIDKMNFKEPISEVLWYDIFEINLKLLTKYNMSEWFINLIIIGNYLHLERENHHLIWVRNVDTLRNIVLLIGKYFLSKNLIEKLEDVFFIQLPEIFNAVENNDYTGIDKNKIENRKKAFYFESKSKTINQGQIEKEEDYY